MVGGRAMNRLLCIFGAVLLGLCGHAARSAEIWLAGVDPFVRAVTQPGTPSDYQSLFSPKAAWSRAAAQVAVFKTSTQWLLNAPDADLREMFNDLRARHIALAFEGLMIPHLQACGQGVEGYSGPGEIARVAERVRTLGGRIDAVAMDEPLWYGHHYLGPQHCAASIEAVARSLAQNVAVLRAAFPNIRIGDIEPLDPLAPQAWADEVIHFADAFRAATGRPLDFVHLDIPWQSPWQSALARLQQRLHAAHLPIGIIYNGDESDQTDLAWTQHASARAVQVEDGPSALPDQAILQSWMRHPSRMLPEDQPGTMTNLLLDYARTRIWRRPVGPARIALIDEHGQPVVGAHVQAARVDVARLTARHVNGIIPPNAASVLLALRLNVECDCTGSGAVRLGEVHLSSGGRETVLRFTDLPIGADGVQSFHAVTGRSEMHNSANVPVVPGVPYALDMRMAADGTVGQAGYLALISLGADGREVSRTRFPLTPSLTDPIDLTTDASGAVDFLALGHGNVRFSFAGAPDRRPLWGYFDIQ